MVRPPGALKMRERKTRDRIAGGGKRVCSLFTLQFCTLLHFRRSIAFAPAFSNPHRLVPRLPVTVFHPTMVTWCRVFQSRIPPLLFWRCRVFRSRIFSRSRPPHLFVWLWFLDNFCTVFVSFISRLNRKIRVPRLLVTVHVFCLSKLRQNAPTLIILVTKMIFFPGEGQPPPSHPTALDAYGALPFLTEILNTPLFHSPPINLHRTASNFALSFNTNCPVRKLCDGTKILPKTSKLCVVLCSHAINPASQTEDRHDSETDLGRHKANVT